MTKMEEICSVSFVDHEAASELLREFTGKEGGVATVDWYLLRNKIADAMSMTRVDEREKCRQLLSEAEKREREARTGWRKLDTAYSNFVNGYGDPYEPKEAHDVETARNMKNLADAVSVYRAVQSKEK